MASIANVFNNQIRRAEQSVTDTYTGELRDHLSGYGWPDHLVSDHLSGYGWPDHLVSAISMRHNGQEHKITYPSHLKEEILTLEYGTQDVPPSPGLRAFVHGRN